MGRYLDYDKIEYIEIDELVYDRKYYRTNTAENENNIPFEDVAPVVHAHWIEKKYRIAPDVFISNACCSACDGISKTGYTDFCPHCGAKMDAEEDTQETHKS